MNYIHHPYGKIAYTIKGSGVEVFLVFHGFGQNQLDMMPWDEIRKPDQRFIFIDMFYHGRSQWFDSSQNLTRATWVEFLKSLQQQEDFDEFHLIGYSMGGKFSLLTYELFGSRVKSLTLIAPDGIKTGLWYSMGSYPGFIHPVFKRLIFKPERFFGIIHGLSSAGLVEKSFVKFVKTQLETRSDRAQAYFVWKVFGGLQLRLPAISHLVQTYQTPVTLFLGDFDKMVTEENLRHFIHQIPNLKYIPLPVGHGQLIASAVEYFKREK